MMMTSFDLYVLSLCIIFDNGGKNMSFKIEVEGVYLKGNEIWNKIKKKLSTIFHSQPIYDDRYV